MIALNVARRPLLQVDRRGEERIHFLAAAVAFGSRRSINLTPVLLLLVIPTTTTTTRWPPLQVHSVPIGLLR